MILEMKKVVRKPKRIRKPLRKRKRRKRRKRIRVHQMIRKLLRVKNGLVMEYQDIIIRLLIVMELFLMVVNRVIHFLMVSVLNVALL
jgi:hypothetical protein